MESSWRRNKIRHKVGFFIQFIFVWIQNWFVLFIKVLLLVLFFLHKSKKAPNGFETDLRKMDNLLFFFILLNFGLDEWIRHVDFKEHFFWLKVSNLNINAHTFTYGILVQSYFFQKISKSPTISYIIRYNTPCSLRVTVRGIIYDR